MSYTAGVGSAGEVFASVFVDFQIVGDVVAVQAITENQLIRWMVKAKVFHEILQYGSSLLASGTTTVWEALSAASHFFH
jgi:hypothetical protein